ncbi:MAG: exodeoxyribonuclease VII small subunit [Clostridia bacterium]|nr:exodeoxyribonuclease VII small subunit [Clostridia bacterium]
MENRSFEDNMRELEEITKALRASPLALDEMMRLYERGAALVKACKAMLDEYEGKVESVGSQDE